MGPTGEIQVGPTQKRQHKSLACCVVEGNLGKEEEKDGAVTAERDVQVMVEEELEEVDLGSDSQEPRPISISASLTETEKSELILLLKEFKDVFAWLAARQLRNFVKKGKWEK